MAGAEAATSRARVSRAAFTVSRVVAGVWRMLTALRPVRPATMAADCPGSLRSTTALTRLPVESIVNVPLSEADSEVPRRRPSNPTETLPSYSAQTCALRFSSPSRLTANRSPKEPPPKSAEGTRSAARSGLLSPVTSAATGMPTGCLIEQETGTASLSTQSR